MSLEKITPSPSSSLEDTSSEEIHYTIEAFQNNPELIQLTETVDQVAASLEKNPEKKEYWNLFKKFIPLACAIIFTHEVNAQTTDNYLPLYSSQQSYQNQYNFNQQNQQSQSMSSTSSANTLSPQQRQMVYGSLGKAVAISGSIAGTVEATSQNPEQKKKAQTARVVLTVFNQVLMRVSQTDAAMSNQTYR